MRSLIVLGVVGLFAQLIDGSLGMAYGVTSSTLLLAAGIAPAAASATVHLSEVGTTLVAGAAHWKFGNVDWRIVGIMAVPGGIGAFAGATLLSNVDGEAATPFVGLLLLSLGAYVMWRFLKLGGQRPQFKGQLKGVFLAPLGVVAGICDALGGGGWGPVGTTSLLSSGKIEPRKVVGSIDTSEFLVSVGASAGFLFALGSQDIDFGWVGALLVGGMIAAPVAAWLVKHLPARILGVAAGGVIILTNIRTVLESFGASGTAVAVAMIVWALAWAQMLVVAIRAEKSARAAERADADSTVSA